MWLDVNDNMPVPKFYYNGMSYPLGGTVTPLTSTYSKYLVSYLPFDNSVTEDTCGNTWTVTGNVSLDTSIKKFGVASLHCPVGGYLSTKFLFDINAYKWTFDCWIYITERNGTFFWFAKNSHNIKHGINLDYCGANIGNASGNSDQIADGGHDLLSTLNEWHHLAVVKTGNVISVYDNGSLVVAWNLTSAISVDTNFSIGSVNNSYPQEAYFDNVRFFRDVALWTSDFTPPNASDYSNFTSSNGTAGILDTVPSSINGGMWLDVNSDIPMPKFYYNGISYPLSGTAMPLTSAYSKYLVSYLPFDNSVIEDTCGNTWTVTGDVSLDTSIKKFGTASLYCPIGAYLSTKFLFDINSYKWTFDCWAYITERNGHFAWFARNNNNRGIILACDGSNIGNAAGNADQIADGAHPLIQNLNEWAHLAVVKTGNVISIYENGELYVAYSLTSTIGVDVNFSIGSVSNSYPQEIYFDNVRFFKDVALWTENFTPPTANDYSNFTSPISSSTILDTVPSTVDGNFWYEVTDNLPALWFHKGNYDYAYFYDKIRFVGDGGVDLAAYLPFNVSTTADACSNEWTTYGSPTIYDNVLSLNGSSYLANDTISDSIGAKPWTIDFWATCTSDAGQHGFCGTYNAIYGTSGYGDDHWVGINWVGGNPGLHFYGIGIDITGTIPVTSGTRHHYAMTYDGTTVRLFIDGVLSVSRNHSIILGGRFVIGSLVSGEYCVTGTFDHFRIFKNVALWTSDFAPPTAANYS